MIPWNPCLKHDWEPVPDKLRTFRCKKPDCKILGYQIAAPSPHSHQPHNTPIRPYECSNPKCHNPTQEKKKHCPHCLQKLKAKRVETVKPVHEINPTDCQLDIIRLLADQQEHPIPKHFAPGRVIDSLHKQGLLKKQQITVWSLSKKGNQLLERLKSEGTLQDETD